eukprot:1195285-Prorocentrum_minimum.AAC.5
MSARIQPCTRMYVHTRPDQGINETAYPSILHISPAPTQKWFPNPDSDSRQHQCVRENRHFRLQLESLPSSVLWTWGLYLMFGVCGQPCWYSSLCSDGFQATTRSRSPANTFLHCAGSTRAPFLLDVFAPGPVLLQHLERFGVVTRQTYALLAVCATGPETHLPPQPPPPGVPRHQLRSVRPPGKKRPNLRFGSDQHGQQALVQRYYHWRISLPANVTARRMSAPSPKPRAVPKAPWGTLLLAWHLRCAAHGELWLTEGRASRVLGQVAMWIYLSLVKSEAQQHMMKMLVVTFRAPTLSTVVFLVCTSRNLSYGCLRRRGEVGSRRGEVGLAESALPASPPPKRDKAKDLVMCPRLAKRAAGGAGSPPW